MAHANSVALCFIEPELLLMKVLHCGNENFPPLWLLWPWIWSTELHVRTWSAFPRDMPDVQIWTSYVETFKSYCLRDRQTDRQTEPKLYTTPLHGWSITNKS